MQNGLFLLVYGLGCTLHLPAPRCISCPSHTAVTHPCSSVNDTRCLPWGFKVAIGGDVPGAGTPQPWLERRLARAYDLLHRQASHISSRSAASRCAHTHPLFHTHTRQGVPSRAAVVRVRGFLLFLGDCITSRVLHTLGACERVEDRANSNH